MKRWGSLKSLWHRIFPSVSSKTTWVDNFVSFFTFKYKRRDTPALYLSKLNFAQTSQNNRWGLWNLKVRVIWHEKGVPLWWTHVNGASVSWLSPVVLALSRACAPLCISRPKSVSKLNWNSPKFWDNSKLSAMLTLPMFTPCGWRTRATIYNKT